MRPLALGAGAGNGFLDAGNNTWDQQLQVIDCDLASATLRQAAVEVNAKLVNAPTR
jgi:hypothetical protein